MTEVGRPTATVKVRDVSGPRRRASAVRPSPEAVLFRAYGEVQPGQVGVFRVGNEEPCACGGVIRVSGRAIRASIDVHNATPKHVAWRAWRETA